MFGFIKYTLELKKWNDWIRGGVTTSFSKSFPDLITKKYPSQKALATFLVDESWIETVQKFTYNSAKSSGMKMTFKEYQEALIQQTVIINNKKTSINVWKNSYERNIVKPLLKSLKSRTTLLTNRYNSLNKLTTEDIRNSPKTLSNLFNTIKAPDKKDKRAYAEYIAKRNKLNRLVTASEVMDDFEMNRLLNDVKGYISNDIVTNQQQKAVAEAIDKSLGFQGRRLAQNQLQIANNEENEKKIKKFKPKKNEVIVGVWSVSPSHKWGSHSPDLCELHATHNEGYGKGGFVGRAPKPVEDSHIFCKCSVKYKLMKKID